MNIFDYFWILLNWSNLELFEFENEPTPDSKAGSSSI
jgi:hypothetical protein